MTRRGAFALAAVAILTLALPAASFSGKAPRLGRPPAHCPGQAPLTKSQPPAPWPRLLGADPLWIGVYAHINLIHARMTVHQDRYYHRKKHGWPIKFLWVTSRDQMSPITATIRRLATGRPVWMHIGGIYNYFTRAPVFDPARPGHPDDPSKPNTHEWGSLVFFPRAGCYSFQAVWPGGGEAFVFSFGRRR